MKIMSFNLRCPVVADGNHYWPLRSASVIRLLLGELPDVVGVQEHTDQMKADMSPIESRYEAIGDGRNADLQGERCTIYVRKDSFEVLNHGTVWLSPEPALPGTMNPDEGFPRIATWVLLKQRSNGSLLRVINTHFAYRSRITQLENIAALRRLYLSFFARDSIPAILMGDFNATPDSDIHAVLKGDGWRDARANSEHMNDLTFHAFNGLPGSTLIDYIYTYQCEGNGYTVNHTSEEGRWPSDHFPIQCEVNV